MKIVIITFWMIGLQFFSFLPPPTPHLHIENLHDTMLFHRDKYIQYIQYIMACRPVARQRPRKKQLYNICYWVTASQTSMFAQQPLDTATEERCFMCDPCRDVINRTVSEVASRKVTLALTLSEVKWSEVKWSEVKWSEVKWSEEQLVGEWVSWSRVAVAEAGDSSGTQSKGNVRRWKPLPSNG
jgi:hypothetical protein